MKHHPSFVLSFSLLAIFVGVLGDFAVPLRANTLPAGFAAHDVNVAGATLHYTTGGHGPLIVLLHGYAETSRMWVPILPVLGEKFTVVAPDLPGICLLYTSRCV